MRGDEAGMFWEDLPALTERVVQGPRPLPPIPETDWQLPAEYPCLQGQGYIAIDCETYDPDLLAKGPGFFRDARMVGIAIGTEAGFRGYYPMHHEIGPNLPPHLVLQWLRCELATPVPKVGANLLYDLTCLAVNCVNVEGPFYDIQVAEPLLDETRLSYSLESIAQHHLGVGKVESAMSAWLRRTFGDEGNIKRNIWRAPPAVVGPYAAGDVDLPLRIFAKQKLQLESLGLWDLFVLESKLIPMLLAMHRRGVCIDVAGAEQLYQELGGRQQAAVDKIKAQAGVQVDIWAAASIAKAFDKLGLDYPRTKQTKAPSFRKEWLEQHQHPVAGLIREARGLDKLKETFIKGYLLEGHVGGRVHCQFHQLRSDEGGTVSGRFSSASPNLQNIPRRTEEGKLIRKAFVAEQDEHWWKLDWSQIEYRLIVHYAALFNLPMAAQVVDRYINDASTDFHLAVAEMTGLSRDDAKNLNFGLAYGQGVALLCRNLKVGRDEGQRIIDTYHERAPFVRPLAERASQRAKQVGEIKTLLRRRRRFNVWEKQVDGKACYWREQVPGSRRAFVHKALNALIQGSAADIMKLAMVRIWEAGVCNALGAPHLTVHDELDGSLPPGPAAREALAEVKRIMESCVQLRVPLRADGGIGPNWGAITEGSYA